MRRRTVKVDVYAALLAAMIVFGAMVADIVLQEPGITGAATVSLTSRLAIVVFPLAGLLVIIFLAITLGSRTWQRKR